MKITQFKILFLSVFFLTTQNYYSQTKALDYFNLAVKNYNAQNFYQADSLFSLSIKLDPSAETFYNRALCRGKMANKNGYCLDLAKATELGEPKALKLFCRSCGKIDTIYKNIVPNDKSNAVMNQLIICRYNDSVIFMLKTKYYEKEHSVSSQFPKSFHSGTNPEVFTVVESVAEFPGGVFAMQKFLMNNIQLPEIVQKNEVSGKVFLKFIVDENGAITNVELLKKLIDCPECDEEAIRLVKSMPQWKPALMQGWPVKCYFNLPISFRPKQN